MFFSLHLIFFLSKIINHFWLFFKLIFTNLIRLYNIVIFTGNRSKEEEIAEIYAEETQVNGWSQVLTVPLIYLFFKNL